MALPLISTHLNCKDWRRFCRKQRLQKCRKVQVIAILARSPKTRIFWKSAKGGPREIFQKSPKKLPSFERPKSTVAEMPLSSNKCALKLQTGEEFGANSGSKSAEMSKVRQFSQSHPKPAFSEKVQKGGAREIFQKSPKKLPSMERPKSTVVQMALSSN